MRDALEVRKSLTGKFLPVLKGRQRQWRAGLIDYRDLCMRIILSQGKVNIFNLAKNAGTSVNQVERFYARNLISSAE